MKLKEFFKKICHADEFLKIVKFGVTGLANTLVDYLAFFFLTSFFGCNLYFAQACSYGAGMLNSYLLNRRWTFRSKRKLFSFQMAKFIITNLFVLLLSMGLLKIFVGSFGWPTLLAKLIIVSVTMVVNFIISRLWVFAE